MNRISQFFSYLWAAAYNLTPEERRRSVRIAAIIGVVLMVLVFAGAGTTASRVVPAEHPIWEAVLQTKLAIIRLFLSFLPLILGAFVAVLLYQVIENADLGKRLLIWHPDDAPEVKAAKTRNGGMVLGCLLAACILGLLLGVLR